MGIRTLHRRPAPAPAQATADHPPNQAQPPVATDASTARIPVDLMTAWRQTATTLRTRLAHRTQGWSELARGYASLALTLLPRSRPGGLRPHPNPHCQAPAPDATP